jgi:hypothetical protein
VLIGLLLVGGAVYSLHLGDSLRFLPDEAEYVTLANNIAIHKVYSMDGMVPTAYRPPGYPAVLSLISRLGGDILHLRFLNYIFLAGCIYLLHSIMVQQGLPLAGLFSGLLVIAYPVLFYASGTLYPQSLAAFLFLLTLKIFTGRNLRSVNFAAGGVIFGVLVLTVPTFLFTIFVILGWIILYRDHGRTKPIILTLATALLVIGAWTGRNYLVFGTFFLISTNSGENLLIGNSEYTTPNAGTTVDISTYLEEAAGLGEVERNQYLTRQAISNIIDHPAAYLKLYLQKVLNYFNYQNELVTSSEGSHLRDLLMLVTYGPLIAVFFIRTLILKQSKPDPVELLFILLYIMSAFVTAIFFSRIRFRLPYDYLLIMVAAIAFERVVKFFQGRKFNSSKLQFLRPREMG